MLLRADEETHADEIRVNIRSREGSPFRGTARVIEVSELPAGPALTDRSPNRWGREMPITEKQETDSDPEGIVRAKNRWWSQARPVTMSLT